MSNIDKRALREVAEKATPGNWHRASSRFNGITVTPFSLCDEEVMLAHAVEKRDAEFIAAANPATMLALLDENIQLQREKDAIEAVALALRDDMRQAREQLEAGWKQNATDVQIKARLCRESNSLHDRLREAEKRIAELEARAVNLPKRSVDEVMHLSGFSRDYAEGWCAGNDNAIHEIRAAGIKVKGE
ncbi:ead/Ea22-like family protein [Salmonella enterica subsp. enterica serovar Saintpaul]|nr:ead/Ea22-like family protein [Salmonella enterica]EBO9803982.1 ead/Ea22-like family protein [Salmonella enterica]EDV0467856.1 ead/Ea22-like family protein [Salmonella enterica subsp. enterica serovar Saintpaul]EMC7470479.1 ead/Ea22-like family protein [Salmonella enterica]